jgi:hypothetical protein
VLRDTISFWLLFSSLVCCVPRKKRNISGSYEEEIDTSRRRKVRSSRSAFLSLVCNK